MSRLITVFITCASALLAQGMIDLDGDGVSELWELSFPLLEADESDLDGDGQSNFMEMVAGTDPTDAGDSLRLELMQIEEGGISLSWAGVGGKRYELQTWDTSQSEWVVVETSMLPELSGGLEVIIPELESREIFRLKVSDVDEDGDGLSAWEEVLLGGSDASGDSLETDTEGLGDYRIAFELLEGASGTPLTNGDVLPQRLPTAEEASRFLVQTSFGPDTASINEVMSRGMGGYFDDQVAMPASLTRASMFASGAAISAVYWRHGWWRSALIAPDQLKQRLAYALSQIFVINTETGTVIGDNALIHAAYYDPFLTGAFGTYRDLLDHVTYSPTMGFYLSYLKNRKSDPVLNRFPDENFAREIMQLFTIGLWELNEDGTRKTDGNGNDIPSYDNEVITEMAKIFTGMSHTIVNNGQVATSFFQAPRGNDYRFPMRVWDEEHELGIKTLFNGVVIPAEQTGEEDVQQTLDALCEHPNMAPFVSRLLIQRFTSSNPSPEYLGRVSRVWNLSEGNLEEVMRAILFDREARAIDRDLGLRGKLREPLIRAVQIMRAFAPEVRAGNFTVRSEEFTEGMGQYAMLAPSVFNFYLPDNRPTGVLADFGLVAPEFQIATTNALLASHNLLRTIASSGHVLQGVDYTEELALVSDPEALVDHLDRLLTYGTMSEETRSVVLDRIALETTELNKVIQAVQMVVISPEFSVLK